MCDLFRWVVWHYYPCWCHDISVPQHHYQHPSIIAGINWNFPISVETRDIQMITTYPVLMYWHDITVFADTVASALLLAFASWDKMLAFGKMKVAVNWWVLIQFWCVMYIDNWHDVTVITGFMTIVSQSNCRHEHHNIIASIRWSRRVCHSMASYLILMCDM